ncbi:helix-turn-helix domain-containing protein [Micromonospora sp. NPDC048063]|uniref:helix-turn-helix domain-containing protein n=1 Tax=Micromonospora sp. NPDC048063 TaxID=3364256 RepID=UPI00370FC8A4
MGDGGKRESWAEYLRRMTDRDGWSVARLARESGIHRATIFRWMSSKGSGANVTSARAIGDALGDPGGALRAAGNMGGNPDEGLDPDLQVIMRRLANPDVPEAEKDAIRTALKYLAQVAESAQPERPGRVVRRRGQAAS